MLGRSVGSDSWRPHGQEPSRLLCPWDFPGKNTGVGYHLLLQGIFPIQGSAGGFFTTELSGKLQIIGPIPGPLNQTQGAGRSRGPGREETAGDGPAQAQQGILIPLEQRSPSGPHGPLPVHRPRGSRDAFKRRTQGSDHGCSARRTAAVVQSLSCV